MAVWEIFWNGLLQGLWEVYLPTVAAVSQIITAVGAFLAAVVALFTALQARRSATAAEEAVHEARLSARGQLAANILERYAEPEMLDAMRTIVAWKENHGEDWAKKFASCETSSSDDEIGKKRRLISHHMNKIWKLRKGGYVNDEFVRLAVGITSAKFYIRYIEPLEAALVDVERETDSNREDYNPNPFVCFGKLYDIDAVEPVRRQRAIKASKTAVG